MGFAGFVDHWWNLPYLVMLGLVVVFAALQVVGLGGHETDADVDHDVDVGGGDADADADVPADADAHPDGDADGDAEHDVGGWQGFLSFLGIGRVPFLVVWFTLFLFGGIAGIFINSVLFTRGGGVYPPWGFPVSLAASLAFGLVAVRLFSRLAARFVDVGGHGAARKHELAGKVGVVASARIDARFGEIRVKDERGNEILVHARVDANESPLARGAEVILVDYDAASELFTVTNADDSKSVSHLERK